MENTHLHDAGCQLYALHRVTDGSGMLVIIERWDSRESLTAHSRSPHSQKSLSELPDLLVEMPQVIYLEAMPAGDPDKGTL